MGITARQLAEMTPGQLLLTFYERATPDADDPLTKLIRTNDERGQRGLRPLCPPWIAQILQDRTRGRTTK